MSHHRNKVAIIDNAIDPHIYNPVRHWSMFLDVPWQAFRPMDGEFPDWRQEDFSHLIITGSEASILTREPWVEEEITRVKEAVERGLSILGSCYGHQVLAVALTDFGHVKRCARSEIGWIPIEIIKDNELLGEPGTAYVFSAHFDEVTDLGRDFDILSRTEHCAIQAFQWKGTSVWGLQYHPEMNIDEALAYIRKSVDKGGSRQVHYEAALESVPQDSGLIHRIVSKFIGTAEK